MNGSFKLMASRWSPNEIGESAALDALAGWVTGRAKELRIVNQGFTASGVASLARISALSTLEILDLSDNHHFIDAKAVRVLASSPTFANLRTLNLGGNEIGVDGVRALVESDQLRSLARLDLSGRDDDKPTDWTSFSDNIGGDAGLELLVSSPWVSQLEMLNVSQNNFTGRGVSTLISSPYLDDLSCLCASTSKVDWEGENTLDVEDQRALQEHFGDRLRHSPFAC